MADRPPETTAQDDIPNPYIGPRTFTEEESDLFFGREREARDLLALVATERLTLFYAQSGAGKSSLIQARLMGDLRREGFEVLPVARVSGVIPESIDPLSIDNIFAFSPDGGILASTGDDGSIILWDLSYDS